MHWIYIISMFVIAGMKAGVSPVRLIKNMLPAYFTALGTMSERGNNSGHLAMR